MGKFQTTNSALFNNNNSTIMPEWMQSFSNDLQIQERQSLELNFDKKGSFADVTNVTRPDCTATPRDVVAGFNNDKAIIDSKIELAKFLKGKYYKTNAKIAGNSVVMNTTIDGIQANFVFEYKYINNKLSPADTFSINETEYPFSHAGFAESLQDLKCGNLKKSKIAIASSRQTYVINREEIVRRFNGSLRAATESINQKLKDGIIVGAGSNTYATFYDPEELFPQLEKEKPEEQLPSFEYVDNTEHVATNECKSAKNLSFAAGKLIAKVFADYIINASERHNNTLTVKATVLNNATGIRHNIDFNFDIINEKITHIANVTYNNTLLSVEDLLSSLNTRNNLVSDYLKTSTASKRIHKGGILTRREIEAQLSTVVDRNKISDFINSWLDLNMITQVGSNVYSTNKTMPELLDVIVTETLSIDEKEKIQNYKKHFGSGLDFDRIDQEDTGVRESDDIELSIEQKLGIVNNELSKHFTNYQIISFNKDNINVMFINDGVRHTIKLKAQFNNRKLHSITALINNNEVRIENLVKAFKRNALLNSYLQKSGANNFSTSIIATESNLLERLSQLTNDAQTILNNWKCKYLTSIGSNLYSSKYTFEELLNMTDAILLSEEDKQQILAAKQHFGIALERIDQEDTGIRESDDIELSAQQKLGIVNNELSKHFTNYQIISFNEDNINAMFINDGVRHTIKLIAKFNNRKLDSITALINNNEVKIQNLVKVFKNNPLLNVYLQKAGANNFSTNIIATESNLLDRLSQLTNDAQVILNNWKDKYLTHIGANLYSARYTFEELLNMTDATLLSEEDKQRILAAKQHFGTALERIEQEDTGIRDAENVITNETLLYSANNYLSKHLSNYKPGRFVSNDNIAKYEIHLFDDSTGLSTNLIFNFTFDDNNVVECFANLNGKQVTLNNIKTVFAMNESLSKYLQIHNGKKFNAPMVITKKDLLRKLSSITNASEEEIDNVIVSWKRQEKITNLDSNTFASTFSLEQLIAMSNIKPLSDEEIAMKLDKSRRDKLLNITSNHIKDNDTRRPEVEYSPEQMTMRARISINSMFADFDILNAEFDGDDYEITARIINPINGLKQALKFRFNTYGGKKLGEIETVSDGETTVDINNILSLLESKNEAINKLSRMSGRCIRRDSQKNIILNSSLKADLLNLTDMSTYCKIVDDLIEAGIMYKLDNHTFASEYSLPDLIEYLSNNDKLDLVTAEHRLKTYSSDIVVDTNGPIVMDTDNRAIEKPVQQLSPKMVATADKIKKLIAKAKNDKKITNNKFITLNDSLSKCTTPNDIEQVWRELKRYM